MIPPPDPLGWGAGARSTSETRLLPESSAATRQARDQAAEGLPVAPSSSGRRRSSKTRGAEGLRGETNGAKGNAHESSYNSTAPQGMSSSNRQHSGGSVEPTAGWGGMLDVEGLRAATAPPKEEREQSRVTPSWLLEDDTSTVDRSTLKSAEGMGVQELNASLRRARRPNSEISSSRRGISAEEASSLFDFKESENSSLFDGDSDQFTRKSEGSQAPRRPRATSSFGMMHLPVETSEGTCC